MNQLENRLVIAMEECSEVSQALSKALRFGLANHNPITPNKTNADDILEEFYQLSYLIEDMIRYGVLPKYDKGVIEGIKYRKSLRIDDWNKVSAACGCFIGVDNSKLSKHDIDLLLHSIISSPIDTPKGLQDKAYDILKAFVANGAKHREER